MEKQKRIRLMTEDEQQKYNKNVLEKGELEHFRYLLTDVYPSGNISIVSDTYNLWKVLTEFLPILKTTIKSRDGKLIIRPDSGAPVEILCGNPNSNYEPEKKGVIELLWDVFGGIVNNKGYKQLDSHIGAIYGDSITLDRCKAICEGLKNKGFASTNMVFGIGSFTYQYLTRDTFGLAFKSTWGKVNEVGTPIYKDPITDNGMKKSARGLLMVNWDYVPEFDNKTKNVRMKFVDYKLEENVDEDHEQSSWNCLQPVYRDGKLLKEWTLKEIRDRLRSKV